MDNKPIFSVSAQAISMVAEISALLEHHNIAQQKTDSLKLRKINQIKTIQSSLAIEGNSLSEKQVTDILNGKKVVAPLREIQEAKNAIAAYALFAELSPYSISDLLKVHNVMMSALIDAPGKFRNGGVGVFDGKKALHIAPPANRVPILINDLFQWLKRAPDHLLIKSCVFHYEFEYIHPFSDGNGRLGRMWQSLILTELHPLFQFLPIETMVHNNQQKYYQSINASTNANDCGIFIDFMLGEILLTLKNHTVGGVNDGVNGGVNRILELLISTPGLRANAIAEKLNIPLRTLQRELSQLKSSDKIEFRGAPKNGGYFVK